MPCRHERRMGVFCFDLAPDAVYSISSEANGPPSRRAERANGHQLVGRFAPGSAPRATTFIWGMVGENQTFDDMDGRDLADLY